MIKNIVRRLTGAVKNAVVWGVAWFALAFATIIGLRTIGVARGQDGADVSIRT